MRFPTETGRRVNRVMTEKEKIVVVVDPDLWELIPGFLENRRHDAVKVGQALENSDFDVIRILGHTMKGVGSGYGFDEITRVGINMEKAAKQKEAAAIEDAVAELIDYLERVEAVSGRL